MAYSRKVVARDGKGELTICIVDTTVGSSHDPYSATTIEVTRGDKSAEWYSDGLGRDHLRFYVKQKNEFVLVREIHWTSPIWYGNPPKLEKMTDRERKGTLQSRKSQLLFKQHVGIFADDAEQIFNSLYKEDPMGHPSRYE